MDASSAPSRDALRQFGAASEHPVRMPGGRGLTWKAGEIVLRPHGDREEANWKSSVLEALEHTAEFRTPRPIRSCDGAWVHGDWEAWSWMPGLADESRVADVIRAGDAFHNVLSDVPRPDFISRSADAWSRADRMAWGEQPLPPDELLARLARAFEPVELPSQLIHGDLLGNVLFADDEPPTIIDWAPYWRPAGLGAAIAAADAACWHGYPIHSLSVLGDTVPEWRQLLIRALVFRMATLHLLDHWDSEMHSRHEPIVHAVIALDD